MLVANETPEEITDGRPWFGEFRPRFEPKSGDIVASTIVTTDEIISLISSAQAVDVSAQ
jgi:ABC-type cobalt transport system substrate-binding protein